MVLYTESDRQEHLESLSIEELENKRKLLFRAFYKQSRYNLKSYLEQVYNTISKKTNSNFRNIKIKLPKNEKN